MVGWIMDLSEWVNLNTPYTWMVVYQISKLDFKFFFFLG